MGKKTITSLFVIAAAMLLALPTQAQNAFKRTGETRQVNLKTAKLPQMSKELRAKYEKATSKQAFGQFAAQPDKQVSFVQGYTKYKSDAKKSERYFVNTNRQLTGFEGIESPVAPLFATTPTIDANGIITAAPAGERKFYLREGTTLFNYYGYVYEGMMDGYVEIVFADDNTVYIKQPIFEFTTGRDSWAKGTVEGDKIIVPVGQPQAYNASWDATLSIYWGGLDADGYLVKNEERNVVTYTIDGDVISLDDSDDENFISVFWDDDDSWVCGEYGTTWTLDEDYDPTLYTPTEAPEDLETELWYVQGAYSDGYNDLFYKTRVNIGFADDEVYIQGLVSSYPNTWVKGTLEDDVVTIPLQYLGFNEDYQLDIWITGGVINEATQTAELADITFKYDAEAKTLTEEGYFFENAASDRIYYVYLFTDVVISAENPVLPVEELPYMNGFETAEDQNFFDIIDANGDNNTWYLAGGYASYTYSMTNTGDDWLMTGGIYLKAGKEYSFSIDAMAGSAVWSPETFEVLAGNAATVDAMTIEVIPATDVTWDDAYRTISANFEVEEDGYYYFGIHEISPADMYELRIDNLFIRGAITDETPIAPRLSVQPDPYGEDKAVVTVVAPSRDFAGNKLTDNLKALNVYRDGIIVKSFDNVKPGSTKVFVDWVEDTSTYAYTAIAVDENGEASAMTDKVNTVIGLDIPATVDGLEAYETATGVHLQWSPVTTGFNGGVVVPGEIEYEVWNGHIEYIFGIFPVYVLDDVITSTTNTEVDLDTDVTSEQTIGQVFVTAKNEAGRVEDDYAAGIAFYIGAPFALPFEENFAATGWTHETTWMITEVSDYANYAISEEASDGDGGAFEVNSSDANQIFAMTPGKVAMRQGNVSLTIDVMGDGSVKNSVAVYVQLPNGETELAGSFIPTEEEYQTYTISLAEYGDQPFVKPIISAIFEEDGYLILDNIKILDLLDYNLVAKIDAPKTVQAGQTAKVNVTVANYGKNAAENYTVKLFAGKDQLMNLVVMDDPIASFEKKTFEGELETTIFDDPADITLRAEVEFDLELDEEDNAAETIITLKQSPVAQPEDVKAEKTDEGIVLTWKAPSNTAEEVVESFENGMNGWIAIDADGDTNNWIYNENPDGESGFKTYEGISSVGSASYINNVGALTPDNWLISPMAVLDGTFSFYAVGQDASWAAEHFAVYVSTTSATDLESFEQVSEEFVATGEWTEYTVDLSEYAGKEGYIAIRHYNVTDMYVLVVDNISFIKKSEDIASYNLYVDGEDGVYDSTEELTYTFQNLGKAKWVAVSSVQTNGKESRPVVVDLSDLKVINAIEQIAGTQKAVDVYTIDGKLLRQQTTDLSGLKGLYIINGQKVLVK